MRVGLICTTCARLDSAKKPRLFWAEVQDDGAHRVDCDKGHVTLYVLQELKFELLFELGLHAIVDGYYREAVSSFTSSLERFYEFAIRVFAINSKIDQERYSDAWKTVSKQSERQLGAYVFSYLSDQGSKPPLLPEKWVAFRNDVIHKGKIPGKEEAIEFSKVVLATMFEPLKLLRTKHAAACERAVFESISAVKAKYEAGGFNVVGTSYPVTLRSVDQNMTTVPDVMERLSAVASYMRPSRGA